ncbi:unnamed protein product [Arctia plantaginis]|uniref:Chemosensory protein n=1 Tax=Arctia plantaginis TaxID=874455 RepID=A0A8S0ZNR3_ARCPL|nr:unnamed protein product [Arctia plantaginis]
MKLLLLLSTLVTLAVTAPSKETEILRDFDIDALFSNDEQRQAIFDCLLDKSPCGDTQRIKDSVITIIKNKCGECNPEEKQKYERLMKTFHDKYGAVYNELMKKI